MLYVIRERERGENSVWHWDKKWGFVCPYPSDFLPASLFIGFVDGFSIHWEKGTNMSTGDIGISLHGHSACFDTQTNKTIEAD